MGPSEQDSGDMGNFRRLACSAFNTVEREKGTTWESQLVYSHSLHCVFSGYWLFWAFLNKAFETMRLWVNLSCTRSVRGPTERVVALLLFLIITTRMLSQYVSLNSDRFS